MSEKIDMSSWSNADDSPTRRQYLQAQRNFVTGNVSEPTPAKEEPKAQPVVVPQPQPPGEDPSMVPSPTGFYIPIPKDMKPVTFVFPVNEKKSLTVKVTVISCTDLEDSISFVLGDTIDFGFPKLEQFTVILDNGVNYKVIFAGGQMKLSGFKVISLLKAN